MKEKALEIRESKNKPFRIAKITEEKETFEIICGHHKIETNCNSWEEVEKYIESKPYELIFMVCEEIYTFFNKQ